MKQLVKSNAKDMLDKTFGNLLENEVFYNPDGICAGYIENLEVLDRKNRDGQEYTQLQFNVKTADGKRYSKRYSTDFAHKYLVQLGVKAAETQGCMVVFKPTGKYKNIGWWAFVASTEEEGEDPVYEICPYQDDSTADIAERLKKLGL